MFESFTPEARAVMQAALGHTVRLGHNYIGTEHLLLGLLTTGSRPLDAAQLTVPACDTEIIKVLTGWVSDAVALRRVGLDPDAMERAAKELGSDVKIPGRGGEKPGLIAGWGRVTPRTVRIMTAAEHVADGPTTGDHLLQAMLDDDSGLAVLVLERLDALDPIRTALAS